MTDAFNANVQDNVTNQKVTDIRADINNNVGVKLCIGNLNSCLTRKVNAF